MTFYFVQGPLELEAVYPTKTGPICNKVVYVCVRQKVVMFGICTFIQERVVFKMCLTNSYAVHLLLPFTNLLQGI